MPKIVVLASGTRGDVQPAVALSSYLNTRSYNVTIRIYGLLPTGAAIPHHTLLFPKMAAIVHHGGSGTTATAAGAGIPQIIVPHMTDQYYVAEQVPSLGIAPASIWRKKLTPERLSTAIKTAVSNAEMKQKCRPLAEKLTSHDSYAPAEKHIREEFLK